MINLSAKPVDTNIPVQLTVTRSKEHDHTSASTQIRSENRVALVESIKQHSNGSVTNFMNSCRGAGETSLPSNAAVRKAVSEIMNSDMVSTGWITNAHYVIDSCNNFITGKKIQGYVQTFETGKYLFKIFVFFS